MLNLENVTIGMIILGLIPVILFIIGFICIICATISLGNISRSLKNIEDKLGKK